MISGIESAGWDGWRVWAIDPGDIHNGIARIELVQADGSRPRLIGTDDLRPEPLIDLVEESMGSGLIDLLVVEEFRLYPWKSRDQGFSDFGTVERIGVLKHLARKFDVPIVLQGASVKKMAIAIARGYGFPLRKLRSGRQDFPGRSQHERDAVAHGVYFAYRGETSPMVRAGALAKRRI